jgi:hypothetical protein
VQCNALMTLPLPHSSVRSVQGLACTLVTLANLAACGGGGDAAPVFTPPTDNFDVATAWHELLTTTRTWAASGVGTDGRTYTLTLDTSPGGSDVFPAAGESAARADAVVSSTIDGVPAQGMQQTYYDPGTLIVLGLRNSVTGSGTTCDVSTTVGTLPSAAKVGENGLLASFNMLDGCRSDSAVVGTIDLRWSIEFEAGTTYFCLTSTERSPGGQVRSVESDCLQVTPGGTLGTLMRVSIIQGGVSVTLRS